MEPTETHQEQESFPEPQQTAWNTVTPLSKYLALALFIILPFVGGYIGYTFAPEKIVEVEKVVEREVVVEKEVVTEVDSSNLLVRSVSSANYALYEETCPNEVTQRGQTCFWLFDMSSGTYVEELNKIAREQGFMEDARVSLISLVYSTQDGKRQYFTTGIPDSGGCCRMLEFNSETMKFTRADDLYFGITASKISNDGRYIASATNNLQTFVVVDLEIAEIIYEDTILNGSLNSTTCAMDGSANTITFSDGIEISYGVYSSDKIPDTPIEGSSCDYELLEVREYKI